MYVREYCIHLVNGEVIRTGECAEKAGTAPILEEFLHTKESGFLNLHSGDGLQAYIPIRSIAYITISPATNR